MKTVAVGSGEALELGEKGDADVLLVHSPEAEEEFMDGGHGVSRKAVMHNDFIVVGPPRTIRRIKGAARRRGVRADREGRGAVRLARRRVGHPHEGAVDLGGGRGSSRRAPGTSRPARGWARRSRSPSQKQAYTLSDRGTYLATDNLDLDLLVEGGEDLLNPYHVIVVEGEGIEPRMRAGVLDWITSPETQDEIGRFGVAEYGEPLFFPDAKG